MAVFLSISKHAPENCPAFSEKHRKSTLELLSNMEKLAKKHGLKCLGSWTDFPEHLVYWVLEGDLDAMEKLQMEPRVMEWLSFNTIETKVVIKNEDVLEMLRKIK
jgi:hypothetical protein